MSGRIARDWGAFPAGGSVQGTTLRQAADRRRRRSWAIAFSPRSGDSARGERPAGRTKHGRAHHQRGAAFMTPRPVGPCARCPHSPTACTNRRPAGAMNCAPTQPIRGRQPCRVRHRRSVPTGRFCGDPRL